MKTTLKNEAYNLIKSRILSCAYPPGTFLIEADLIAELDASRTPIREALNKLEQEGLVQILPKKGVMVTSLSLAEINQTFEARLLMEPYIIRNYMDRIDREALTRILDETQTLIAGEPDPAALSNLDDVLHREINKACRNRYVSEILEHIYDENQRIRLLSGRDIWARHVEAAREHITLIETILDGKAEEAAALLTTHLQHSRDAAINSLVQKQINAV